MTPRKAAAALMSDPEPTRASAARAETHATVEQMKARMRRPYRVRVPSLTPTYLELLLTSAEALQMLTDLERQLQDTIPPSVRKYSRPEVEA